MAKELDYCAKIASYSVDVAGILNADRLNEVWDEYDSTRNTQNDMSIWRLKFYIAEALVFGYEKGLADGKGKEG